MTVLRIMYQVLYITIDELQGYTLCERTYVYEDAYNQFHYFCKDDKVVKVKLFKLTYENTMLKETKIISHYTIGNGITYY